MSKGKHNIVGNGFSGVHVHGDLGAEERVPDAAWRSHRKLHRGGNMWAENRRKHRTFPGTKPRQPGHVNICGGGKGIIQGDLARDIYGCYTACIGEMDR